MSDPMNELWFKINKLHCLYIEAEDSPAKIDYETNLGGLIHEFLSIVPHNCKFHLTETAQILKRSVVSNPDFSTYKLSNAWISMHKYASNLLSQPWRKEFTTIKLYSGFFKHQIEPVLVGGVLMLELMGYRETQPGHLELLEPIDGDKVRVVALDSFIAMVECQILRIIYDEVSKVVSTVSWKEIVDAREMLAGPPELISKQLISKLHISRHCRSSSYGAACSSYPTAVPCNGYGSSLPLHTAAYMPPAGSMNGYYCQHYGHNVPISYSCNVPSGKLIDLDPLSYTRHPESFSRSPPPLSSKPREESWGYVLETLEKPSTSSNNSKRYSTSNGGDRYLDHHANESDSLGRQHNGSSGHNTGSDPVGRVHEGLKSLRLEETHAAMPRLIDDVDGETTRHRVKEGERRRNYGEDRTLERHRKESEREREREKEKAREREKERGKERERERDRERQEREYRKRERDLTEKEKALRCSISPENQYETELLESRAREEASYDAGHVYAGLRVNLTPENVTQPVRVNLSEQPLRVNLTPENQTQGKANSGSLNGNQGVSKTSGAKSNESVRPWDCAFCTYRNRKGDICGMCSKSKNSGVELKPLESGGRQCPKCTLVNDKTARQCEACNESLENSATYI